MDLYLMAGDARDAAAPRDARAEALGWFDRLSDPLRRYLLCAGASAADADEIVQESFLRLYQHLEKNGERSNVEAWVFRVARNCVRDQRKSARHRCTVPLSQSFECEDAAENPETCALALEREQRLRAALEKLPRRQRECMLLRSAGLRYREIAQALRMNPNSVGGLVQRAVARLSEELS